MSGLWLVGAGPMARDYVKVLESLKTDYVVIGRGKASADECRKVCSHTVFEGGLDLFLKEQPEVVHKAIVAVPVQHLFSCVVKLIEYGVKSILVEKPAGLNALEIKHLNQLSQKQDVDILLAYNRRFYSSVKKAKEIIQADSGLRSCVFEFTEWSHIIEKLDKPEEVFQKWFIGNSTHVVDLVFHLIGCPVEISCFTQGSLSWHNSAAQFSGAGISEQSIVFSYHADWLAPGRWSIELMTAEHRLIFKPMEGLKIIKSGTVKVLDVDLDDALDKKFKPGLYVQTERFLADDYSTHCSIEEQAKLVDYYYRMANYE